MAPIKKRVEKEGGKNKKMIRVDVKESIKATAAYSGRGRKVAFGVDKREATSR
jgi:hypothetical protein